MAGPQRREYLRVGQLYALLSSRRGIGIERKTVAVVELYATVGKGSDA